MENEQIWEDYIKLLKSMDWFYEYSDDSSVFTVGNIQKKTIKFLTTKLVKIDEDRVKEISKNLFPEGQSYKDYIIS